jgi:hypothetical protein
MCITLLVFLVYLLLLTVRYKIYLDDVAGSIFETGKELSLCMCGVRAASICFTRILKGCDKNEINR